MDDIDLTCWDVLRAVSAIGEHDVVLEDTPQEEPVTMDELGSDRKRRRATVNAA